MKQTLRWAVAALVGISLIASPSPSGANEDDMVTTRPESIQVSSHQGSQHAGGGGSGVTYRDCVDEGLTFGGLESSFSWIHTSDDVLDATGLGYRRCTRVADGQIVGWITGLPAAAGDPVVPSSVELAALAQADLRLELPEVATSPPRGGIQLVAIPVWFWVTNFDPATATASIPGLSATLTATPVTTKIITGDGKTLTCQGPGIAYDPTLSWRSQRSQCSHPYTDPGHRTITATTTWSLEWAATDGQTGVLPNAQRTSTFELTIQEAQPVVS